MSGISIPAAARAVVKALEPMVRWSRHGDDPPGSGRFEQFAWTVDENGDRIPLYADMWASYSLDSPHVNSTFGGRNV